MLWWINKHKHSISIVHIFRVISFKAFCKFLRRRNSAWGFWGVSFWSRDFVGGFVGSPRDFVGFWLLPPFDHPHHLKSRVYPSLRGGRAYSQEALVWYAWPMRWASFWGRRVIGAWVYSRKYSNCLKCGNMNIKVLYMIHWDSVKLYTIIEVTQGRC